MIDKGSNEKAHGELWHMMSQQNSPAQPSPLPWRYDGERLIDANGDYVTVGNPYTYTHSTANGNFIVTACNAHAALVEALKLGLAALMASQFSVEGGTEHTAWGQCPECGNADWEKHASNCSLLAIITQMQTALAAAGKE